MVYVFVFFLILDIVSFSVPKSLNRIEIYATSFFAYAFGLTTDVVLDLHYDLYGYLLPGFQWLSMLAIIMYFPSVSFLFLNFFPFHKRMWSKIIYILAWSAFSISFEWLTLQTDFFYYNGWKLWYSAVLYPFIFFILVCNLKLVRKQSANR
ncbi:CBO0543 family protein [Paenibacillus favisporus]|uniref:CBO0543 family protein n=1 Tax=Paenibacillus favisporus TaxID=221028 RepID=UPI003B832031